MAIWQWLIVTILIDFVTLVVLAGGLFTSSNNAVDLCIYIPLAIPGDTLPYHSGLSLLGGCAIAPVALQSQGQFDY